MVIKSYHCFLPYLVLWKKTQNASRLGSTLNGKNPFESLHLIHRNIKGPKALSPWKICIVVNFIESNMHALLQRRNL